MTSSKIINQAALTLETVHINCLNARRCKSIQFFPPDETVHFIFKGIEEIKDCPIDFGVLSSLREIAISSFASVERYGGTGFLHALCQLLSIRDSAFQVSSNRSHVVNSTIEIVRLNIHWGSVTFGNANVLFEHDDPGWEELDGLFSHSPLFRRLKMVEIRVKMIIRSEGTGIFDVKGAYQLRNEISQRTTNLFRTLRAARSVKLTILIDSPSLV